MDIRGVIVIIVEVSTCIQKALVGCFDVDQDEEQYNVARSTKRRSSNRRTLVFVKIYRHGEDTYLTLQITQEFS